MEAGDSLTGVWDGRFTYPRALAPVSFQAVLEEAGGGFAGAIEERVDGPGEAAAVRRAVVNGRRDGGAVEFIKRYVGDDAWRSAVLYVGDLRDDGREIEGRWVLPSWSGWFLMVRGRGREATARRRTFERA